jgi:SAM-dependent methyltransferase
MNDPGRVPEPLLDQELTLDGEPRPEPDPASPEPSREPELPSHYRWRQWLASPAGQYVLAWEQAHFNRLVPDLFGYVGLQCGLREIDSLAQNRMRSRLLVSRSNVGAGYDEEARKPDVIVEGFEELPFGDQTVDLVTLPHVLEFASDPHQVLREVDRVLRPEGRVIVTAFNPVSLWGLQQALGNGIGRPFIPADGVFISLPRLRDWYKLLSFEFTRGSYGCYRPPSSSEKWLSRTEFMEKAGDRWWPICGAVYCVTAVKKVRGMRVIGPAWIRNSARQSNVIVPTQSFRPRPAPAPVERHSEKE